MYGTLSPSRIVYVLHGRPVWIILQKATQTLFRSPKTPLKTNATDADANAFRRTSIYPLFIHRLHWYQCFVLMRASLSLVEMVVQYVCTNSERALSIAREVSIMPFSNQLHDHESTNTW